MNQESTQTLFSLVELLKTGRTLRIPSAGLLARQENERILVSSAGYTARLSIENFLELYGSFPAAVLEEGGSISEEKDEEYYAWRREKQ